MSVLTAKRVGLSVVGITTVGGIIKAAIGASPSSVIPLAEAENFLAPPKQLDGNLNTGSDSSQAKVRNRRDTGHQDQTYFSDSKQFEPQSTLLQLAQSEEEEFRRIQKVDAFLSRLGIYPEDIQKEQARLGKEGLRKVWEKAETIYKTLDDYSFKLLGPCVSGTGWILDYQLPDREGQYPTTWYIATNAHVIQNFRFSKNPYEQLLPQNMQETNLNRQKSWGNRLITKHKELALDNPWCANFKFGEEFGYLDFNLYRGEEGVQRKGDYGAVGLGEMEEPSLFFSAFDFLEKNPLSGTKDSGYGHYSDFVVLEITFKDEKYARRTTNDFADKYGVNSANAINIFGAPAETKDGKVPQGWEEENVYLLAYPGSPGQKASHNKWLPTKNFDERSGIASRLKELTKNKKMFPDDTLWWGNQKFKEFGHGYGVYKNPLRKGSSGGLLVDKNLNALGLNTSSSAGFVGGAWSLSTPLRSNGITFKYAGDTITTPKYDLILGAEGQTKSYKQQVMEYIVNRKKKQTWLSTRGGWNAKSQPNNLIKYSK